jgi:hypothetical protein
MGQRFDYLLRRAHPAARYSALPRDSKPAEHAVKDEEIMKQLTEILERAANRRSFLKSSMVAGEVATVGAGILGNGLPTFAQEPAIQRLPRGSSRSFDSLPPPNSSSRTLWIQYAELGGIGKLPPIEVNPNEKSNPYQVALTNLDSDGPQYLSSNTLDEVSHAAFLNAYLEFQLHRVRNFAGKHSQRING